MDSANAALPDLDGLSVAELKVLLREQHVVVQEQSEQLAAKDAELLSHRVEIEALKPEILKLRRLQFGQKSEKRAYQIEQLELRLEELETTEAQLPRSWPYKAKQCLPHALPRRGGNGPAILRARRKLLRRMKGAARAVTVRSNRSARTFQRRSSTFPRASK